MVVLFGLFVLATGCGLQQTVTDARGMTWYQGTGETPSVEEVGCAFGNSEAPDEPLPPDIMAVIEWGGYESYGGRWIEPRDEPIVEGQEQGPLIVAIVGDAAGFEQWLDSEPGRREESGIGNVVEGEIPYCLLEHELQLLPSVPGWETGGIAIGNGLPILEVTVEAISDVDLSYYPPFMHFTDELQGTFETIPLRLP